MKRVLLTGGGGFVGSHTLRHLLRNTDWDIVLTDSFRHKGITDRVAQQMRGFGRNRVRVVVHDLTVPMSRVLVNEIGRVDYVISMASESHVDRSIEDPRTFILNNVALVLTMLDYARIVEPEKFVQVSTDEVYGPASRGHDHVEWETHRPSNPYSASKAAQEDVCYSYWRTYGLPVALTNTMNIIGEMQDPEKFVPMVIKRVLTGETVPVHGTPEAIGSRYYLHARNQADALLHLLRNVDVPRYGEGEMAKYHVVGEREVDNLEMARMIAYAVGKPLHHELVDFHSTRPGHDLRYALDGSKIAATGWKPPLPLEESLVRSVRWTLAHPEWLDL